MAVATVALIPLLPAVPYDFLVDVPHTTCFASAAAHDLPEGKVTLLYPYPSGPEPQGMLWQIESGMRYSMPGGYFLVPQGPGGPIADTLHTYSDYTSELTTALSDLYAGVPAAHSPAALTSMRHELLSWHVQSAVAIPAPGTAPKVVAYLSWLIGRPPARQSGAYVWYHLGRTLRTGS